MRVFISLLVIGICTIVYGAAFAPVSASTARAVLMTKSRNIPAKFTRNNFKNYKLDTTTIFEGDAGGQSGNPSWTLIGTPSQCGGDREWTALVQFPQKEQVPTAINLSVTQLDALNNANLRYRIEADHLTDTGFLLHVITWCDSSIYSIRIHWQAIF